MKNKNQIIGYVEVKCEKCDGYYNGYDPLSHNRRKCKPSKRYKEMMKKITNEIKKEFKGFK